MPARPARFENDFLNLSWKSSGLKCNSVLIRHAGVWKVHNEHKTIPSVHVLLLALFAIVSELL